MLAHGSARSISSNLAAALAMHSSKRSRARRRGLDPRLPSRGALRRPPFKDLGRRLILHSHRAAAAGRGNVWRHCGQVSFCLFKPWRLSAKVALVVFPVLLIVTT
jgi:hypothetical protein